jgi:hypothetical protein
MAIHNGTQLANMAIGGFVDTGVLHRTIWKDPNFSGVAGKGATVNVRRLGKDTAANFAGTATASTVTQNVTAITLSHQPYMKRAVSSADQVLKVEDYYAEIIAPDVGAIGEYIEATVAATLAASTATALTGASARAAIIEAREYLTSKKVPLSDRFLACSPAFVSGILGEDWVTADKFGDEGSAIVESTHIADVDFDTGGADATAYAYHRSGVAFAARMLSAPEGGAKGSSVAADGLSARIVEDWDNTALSDVVTVDTLFGVARVLDQDVAAPDGSAFDEDHRIVPVYL